MSTSMVSAKSGSTPKLATFEPLILILRKPEGGALFMARRSIARPRFFELGRGVAERVLGVFSRSADLLLPRAVVRWGEVELCRLTEGEGVREERPFWLAIEPAEGERLPLVGRPVRDLERVTLLADLAFCLKPSAPE